MLKTNDAAGSSPQTDDSGDKASEGGIKTTHIVADQRFMVATAVSLAWQLALVVIVPIVGGYILDQHYHKSPLLTLGGLVIALIGVFGVLSRVAIEASRGGKAT